MKCQLELRDISSADAPNVLTWLPSSPDAVCIQITIEIGEKGKEGGHLFQFLAATPQGLEKVARDHPGHEFPDRNILVFAVYSPNSLLSRVNRIIDSCARGNWQESIDCLQRFFQWEYEDIRIG